ncbi:MAG: HipA N-terminal domain-containing protein [Bdellovibrionales bacterium]|nr:HipA N-terminal domain-containing protein [Bdellovibrionales bacterium]
MNSSGHVYYKDQLAGTIELNEGEYCFRYDPAYLNHPKSRAISLTLPLQAEEFRQQTLFSFFDGLIPEGWLLDVAEKNWKLNPKDRMSLLLTLCEDCVGAVRVIKVDVGGQG